jgi:uncharacterized membrane protein HdeD (DUF308 family)
MNIVGLLLGITLVLWALTLLGIAAVSSTVLGIFALITGIAYILVSFGVHSGTINR